MRACRCCVAFRSNYYDPSDVWSPLMLQKPLLMDPVNPFSNVADPQVRARNRRAIVSSGFLERSGQCKAVGAGV